MNTMMCRDSLIVLHGRMMGHYGLDEVVGKEVAAKEFLQRDW
jgi:hypothetical protein